MSVTARVVLPSIAELVRDHSCRQAASKNEFAVHHDWYFPSLRFNKDASILTAARVASACSQNRNTIQPFALKCLSVLRSRRTLASIFARHQAALFLGHVACIGQACQKHPSTKTASLR